MKLFIQIVIFLIGTSCFGQSNRLGVDKLHHFTAGFMIGSSTTVVAQKLNLKYPELYGIGLTLLAGVTKEIYDNNNNGTVEGLDVLSSTVGGALGVFTIKIGLNKKNKHKSKCCNHGI